MQHQFNRPGTNSTKGRTFRITFLLNEAPTNPVVESITDNVNNCQTFNKGVEAGKNSATNNLFKHFSRNIAVENIDITVRWMPSHLKGEGAEARFHIALRG